ncbi:DNA alkylation repair protein [Desertihabitans aurantiacus]|uniref:DNA alkylation repair protein n=1 Tax=Desertihabitans aurantiacus TaxID=2282477 RepID=UPI000DF752B8|nr:DNA alkylation repair protein [Desertihabitans aurantiacus]
MSADETLLAGIRADLAAAADPVRAAQQQAYMKSALPFHGVGAPGTRALLRPRLRDWSPADREQWEGTVRVLWDSATHREHRYAALALARHPRARGWRDVDALPLLAHLVTTGAWWDVVDETASHLVGEVLLRHRAGATPVVRGWATADDLWLRRTAVLAQLRHREHTDTALLTAAVEANLDDPSFWLRKAIGWALRQHARTDPDWVRAAVARWGERLAPLSRREALKHL